MKSNYLTTMTVQIPREGTVIRNEKTVEYQMDRTYAPEDKSTRVKRKVIGKVDPLQPGRMLPNELYFEIFPDNEVPEEIRDEFLRDCAIKREMKVIRRNPGEIVDRVVEGLDMLSQGLEEVGEVECGMGPGPDYVMIRRVFDEIYFAIEELAGKFPNEVMDPFKVERINEVLEEMRGLSGIVGRRGQGKPAQRSTSSALRAPSCPGLPPVLHWKLSTGQFPGRYEPQGEGFGPDSPVPSGPSVPAGLLNPFGGQYLRLVEEGLTYSDVLMLMKWYKVMPR